MELDDMKKYKIFTEKEMREEFNRGIPLFKQLFGKDIEDKKTYVYYAYYKDKRIVNNLYIVKTGKKEFAIFSFDKNGDIVNLSLDETSEKKIKTFFDFDGVKADGSRVMFKEIFKR